MMDIEKIKQRLQIIRDNVRELEEMRTLSLEDLSTNRRDLAAAEHFIRIAIEAMIDIGAHIVAKRALGVPTSNTEIMLLLGEKEFLNQENITTYVRMIKYRNRLVHFYHEVTVAEVYDIIQNHIEDFNMFIRDIVLYLGESE